VIHFVGVVVCEDSFGIEVIFYDLEDLACHWFILFKVGSFWIFLIIVTISGMEFGSWRSM